MRDSDSDTSTGHTDHSHDRSISNVVSRRGLLNSVGAGAGLLLGARLIQEMGDSTSISP